MSKNNSEKSDKVFDTTSSAEVEQSISKTNHHVSKRSKMGPKRLSPSISADGAGVRTTTKQSFDYVSIKGISQRTNYPPAKLPEFIVKELTDNAIDFLNDSGASRMEVWLNLRLEKITYQQEQQLEVLRITVSNSNEFGIIPFADVPAVFDMNTFDSTKRHQHRISGGALGDALKECLAIPYALISSTDDGSSFERKQWKLPLVLRFCGQEYRVYLHVDKTNDNTPIYTRVDGPYESQQLSSSSNQIVEVQVTIPLIYSVLGDCSDLIQRLQQLYNTYKLCNGKRIQFHFDNEEEQGDQ